MECTKSKEQAAAGRSNTTSLFGNNSHSPTLFVRLLPSSTVFLTFALKPSSKL
jgi:hypothetical protein